MRGWINKLSALKKGFLCDRRYSIDLLLPRRDPKEVIRFRSQWDFFFCFCGAVFMIEGFVPFFQSLGEGRERV